MKKTLTLCIVLIATTIFAQETDTYKTFTYGVETGINFNNFNRPGSDIGFKLGALANYNSGDVYNLRIGVRYSQVGGQAIDRTVTSIPGASIIKRDFLNRSIQMHSIEVPLSIHFSLPETTVQDIYPDIYTGIAYNAIMYVNERRDEIWYSSSPTPLGDPIKTLINGTNEAVTSSYKTHTFSAIIGTNMYIKLSETLHYFIGAEYKIGLSNIKKTPYPYGGNMRMNQFSLKLGVIFN